jgi:hypothetical protein
MSFEIVLHIAIDVTVTVLILLYIRSTVNRVEKICKDYHGHREKG